jgi:hypothetical protein
MVGGSGVEPILAFAYISGKLLRAPRLFSLKTKKYLRRHRVDSRLEYIYFMKMGQPKLSEGKSYIFGTVLVF